MSVSMEDSLRRDRASMAFWLEYVRTARAGSALPFDGTDQMRVAINEWFGKIDLAIGEANKSGCIFFNCRQSRIEPIKLTLLFSDGKGRVFRRTLKIDSRFRRNGVALNRQESTNLKIALQTIVLNEGKIRPDPKGGWIV